MRKIYIFALLLTPILLWAQGNPFEGFESGNFLAGGWSVSLTNSPTHSGSSAVKLNNLFRFTRNFAPVSSGTVDLTVWIRAGQTDKDACLIALRSSQQSTKDIVVLYPRQDGMFNAYSGAQRTTLQSYNANTWYKIRIVANTGTSKFDVYIDDVKKADQFSFQVAGLPLDMLVFYSEEVANSAAFVDDISLTTPSGGTYSDGFESGGLASSGWSESVVSTMSHSGGFSAKVSNLFLLTKSVVLTAPAFRLSSWIRCAQTNKDVALLALRSSQAWNQDIVVCYPRSDGFINAYDGSQRVPLQSYSQDSWNKIEIVGNSITSKFDIYINDQKKGSQLNFQRTGLPLDLLVLYSEETANSVAYIDDISIDAVTDVASEPGTPMRFQLHQNYPNPFNPSTTISYSLPKSSSVSVKVLNVLGQEVATLVNEQKAAGSYSVRWNAANVASGIYFYRLQAGEYVETKKMILLM